MSENLDNFGLNKNIPSPSLLNPRSVWCATAHGLGKTIINEKDIDGNAGEVVTDLWQIDATIEVIELWGIFTDVSDVDVLTGCYWDLDDGANQDLLTADGEDCSGATVDSFIGKLKDEAENLVFLDADQIRYSEGEAGTKRAFVGGIVNGKNGATNKIRFICDTDGDTDVTIEFYLVYNCRKFNGDEVVNL